MRSAEDMAPFREGMNFKRILIGKNVYLYQRILMAVHIIDFRSSVIHILFTKKEKQNRGKQWAREKCSPTANVFHVSPSFSLRRVGTACNGLW
jgi:hypothetical protein